VAAGTIPGHSFSRFHREERWASGSARRGNRPPLDRSRALHACGMLAGLEIQRVLSRTGRGRRKALVWGWPTPNALTAGTVLPPLPGQPAYGPAAREEARRFLREAKREKINLGWSAKRSLCRVAKGERPLSYSVWERTQAYVGCARRERKQEQDVRERPLVHPTPSGVVQADDRVRPEARQHWRAAAAVASPVALRFPDVIRSTWTPAAQDPPRSRCHRADATALGNGS